MNIRTLTTKLLVRRVARLGAVAALGIAALGATAGAAQAEAGYAVSWSSPYLITASYDLYDVAVADGSTANDAPVIQWPADDGSEQTWYFGTATYDGVYQGTFIKNANSGECLDTDGNAGDQVVQSVCAFGDGYDMFNLDGGLDAYDALYNIGTGLYLDVSGYSWNAGADIDLWYGNNQPNQTFFLLPFYN
jgi:hypothetical protein